MEICSYCKSKFPKEQGVPGGGRLHKGEKLKYFCDEDCLDLWKRETRKSTTQESEFPPVIYYSPKEPTRADRNYHGQGYNAEEHLGARAPNDRPEKDWEPGVVILETKARDNHGHEYHVTLERKATKWNPEGEPVLVVGHTGGRWLMSTLMEKGDRHNEIWIDMGQDWKVINFRDIYREALKLVQG